MADSEKVESPQVPAVAPQEYYYPPAPYYYEDEIDLRDYVNVLIKYWWVVVGVPLVAVVVAAILGFFVMSPKYQATALVAITSPRYMLQFSPNFETVPLSDRQIPFKAYPALATSDDLLQRVLPKVSERLPEASRTLAALRGMVSAKNGQDPSIIELTVKCGDPEVAAFVANIWADEFATMVEEVYGQSASEVAAFEEQLRQAEATKTAAEQAVIEFQARNSSSILQAQIGDKKSALSSYLATKRSIERVIRDAQNLRDRLSLLPDTAKSTLGDDLSTLMLEVNSLSSSASLPLQLQIQGSESLSERTVSEQISFLDSLVAALAQKASQLDERIEAVQPEIMALQKQLAEIETEQSILSEQLSVARNLYHSLTLKLEEARLDEKTNGREVQVAARAVPPAGPSEPRKMLMIGVAGALGLMIGVFGAFVINFFASAPSKDK